MRTLRGIVPELSCAHALLLLASVLSCVWPCRTTAQSTTAGEDAIRAAMVSHLALFVEWPPEKTDPAHPQLNVCVLGADPIGSALDAAFRHAASLSEPVVISHVSATDKLDQCHILYVGAGAHGNLSHLAAALQQSSVLTVSERPIGSAGDEVIGLPLQDSHVRIEVNLVLAQHSKLVISSRLLRLASVVKQP